MNAEEKVEIYKKALESCKVLKQAGVKVMKHISKLDEIYFKIINMLQNFGKNTNEIKALNPGKNLREELYNPEYTQKTNQVSKEYFEYGDNEENRVNASLEEVNR